ncbi:MAG: TRAP transporter substrate-binding protein DctP [Magnetococcales bacterium]|nr:TRAP transporter substrate-binding protein DctP [Magnetococcales bacterium]
MRPQIKNILLLATTLFFVSAPVMGESINKQPPQENQGVTQAIPMRVTGVHSRNFGYIQALETMATTIDEASDGRIKVELLIGGKGGSEVEALKKQIHNKVEAGLTSATTMAYSLPAFRLLTIPLLFTAPSHVENFIDSQLDMAIRETADKKHLKVLGYGSYGFYGLLAFEPTQNDENDIDGATPSSDEIAKLVAKELAFGETEPTRSYVGLSVRAPVDRWMWKIHKALSIKQVIVPVADLPGAIESGWVEGVVSTPETLAKTPYPAKASHYFDIRQQHGWSVFTVNKRWFDKLEEDLQQIVEKAVTAASTQMRKNAFYQSYTTRSAWSDDDWPQIVQPQQAELEASFRPLVFKTARQLEHRLRMSRAISRLWEKNRRPQSNFWPLPIITPNKKQDFEVEPMSKLERLIKESAQKHQALRVLR